jgi:hypothetical protein
MKRNLFLVFILFSFIASYGQKVMFLHHSTGDGVYYEGNVSGWITNYNVLYSKNYQISERAYPDIPYPWANYPFDYWNLWINNQCNNSNPNIECLDKLTQNFDVIIFKHCFPGAAIAPDNGNPSISSSSQTLENYKLQYRSLRTLMDSYPTRKFIVWTLAPLHRLSTNTEDAARARQFVDWVKGTWLIEDAKSHPNIFIFDFFGYVAENNPTPSNGKVNCLRYEYEGSHTGSDSHPNKLANETVGPLFAQFIVNTIQNTPTTVDMIQNNQDVKIFPNPASDEITIDLTRFDNENSTIEICDLNGKSMYCESSINQSILRINTFGLSRGVYIVTAKTSTSAIRHKLLILR